MAHISQDKKKLLNRIHRIRGQLTAIETMIEDDKDCTSTLQTIAACRGAINGLMVVVLEGHVSQHVASPNAKPNSERGRATQELIDVIRTYLR